MWLQRCFRLYRLIRTNRWPSCSLTLSLTLSTPSLALPSLSLSISSLSFFSLSHTHAQSCSAQPHTHTHPHTQPHINTHTHIHTLPIQVTSTRGSVVNAERGHIDNLAISTSISCTSNSNRFKGIGFHIGFWVFVLFCQAEYIFVLWSLESYFHARGCRTLLIMIRINASAHIHI